MSSRCQLTTSGPFGTFLMGKMVVRPAKVTISVALELGRTIGTLSRTKGYMRSADLSDSFSD
jgi:hypothetical protein